MPGLLLLAAEGLTRLGGAALVKLVTNADAAVVAPIETTDAVRLQHGLIVLAVGGVGALIAGARSLRAQRLEEERERAEEARGGRPGRRLTGLLDPDSTLRHCQVRPKPE